MKNIGKYLKMVADGTTQRVAFQRAFDIPQEEYEEELTIQIARWAKSGAKNP